MTRKRKANITPEDVDTYYTDGQVVYKLTDCEREPHAIMVALRVEGDKGDVSFKILKKPISEFANFVRLKPEKPIPLPPKERKLRSDRGIPRKPKAAGNQPQIETSTPKAAATKVDLISTFSVVTGQGGKPHTLKIGGISVTARTLKAGVEQLLGLNSLTKDDVEKAPESEGRRKLQNILNKEREEK